MMSNIRFLLALPFGFLAELFALRPSIGSSGSKKGVEKFSTPFVDIFFRSTKPLPVVSIPQYLPTLPK